MPPRRAPLRGAPVVPAGVSPGWLRHRRSRSGSSQRSTPLPSSHSGLTENPARQQLEDTGFQVETTDQSVTDPSQDGIVIDQRSPSVAQPKLTRKVTPPCNSRRRRFALRRQRVVLLSGFRSRHVCIRVARGWRSSREEFGSHSGFAATIKRSPSWLDADERPTGLLFAARDTPTLQGSKFGRLRVHHLPGDRLGRVNRSPSEPRAPREMGG
jgi:hypothetical protein